jgi:hypothetical protein
MEHNNKNIICPNCGKLLEDLNRCRFCGAEKRNNPESGNSIWMIRGRVIAAPEDMEIAEEQLEKQRQLTKKFLNYGKE